MTPRLGNRRGVIVILESAVSVDTNPAEEDPHGECRHEIQQLQAEVTRLNAELAALRKQLHDPTPEPTNMELSA